MKTNKSKVQKNNAKKAVRKELERSLAQKFFEVVFHLGHDAEKISGELAKAAKSVAGKLAKKFKTTKTAKELKPTKKKVEKKVEQAKKINIKQAEKAQKEVKKAIAIAKPLVNSIKVLPVANGTKAVAVSTKPVKKVIVRVRKVAPVVKKAVTAKVIPAAPAAKRVSKTTANAAKKEVPTAAVKTIKTTSVPKTVAKPVVTTEKVVEKTTDRS